MTRIEAETGVITQINIFKTDPAQVESLVATLKEAASAVKHVPGWLSINLHVALDSTQVANYAQCETTQAWDDVMAILYQRGFIDRIVAIAPPEPCLYEVTWTLERSASQTQ